MTDGYDGDAISDQEWGAADEDRLDCGTSRCCKCHQPTTEFISCYIMGKWLCDSCAAACEDDADARREQRRYEE